MFTSRDAVTAKTVAHRLVVSFVKVRDEEKEHDDEKEHRGNHLGHDLSPLVTEDR